MDYKERCQNKRANKEKYWRNCDPRKDQLDRELRDYDVPGVPGNYEKVGRDKVDHPSKSSLRALHTIKGASHMYCPEIAYSFCMGWKRQYRYYNRQVMHRHRKKTRMPVHEGKYDIFPLL